MQSKAYSCSKPKSERSNKILRARENQWELVHSFHGLTDVEFLLLEVPIRGAFGAH